MIEEKLLLSEYIRVFAKLEKPLILKKRNSEKMWTEINRGYGLSKNLVQQHLDQKIIVGTSTGESCLFGLIDIDSGGWNKVETICAELKLSMRNSMVCTSQSKGHYHILFRPEYHGASSTVIQLRSVLAAYCDSLDVELYPWGKRKIRLPFGTNQLFCSFPDMHWKGQMQHFLSLEPYELDQVPSKIRCDQSQVTNENKSDKPNSNIHELKQPGLPILENKTSFIEGKHLLDNGLFKSHSRHHSQFKTLAYLKSMGYSQMRAEDIVFSWIRNKHNHLSDEIHNGNQERIRKEIHRQSTWIWNQYYSSCTTRKEIFICKTDIANILTYFCGNLSRSTLLYELLCIKREQYPHLDFFPIHSDRLKSISNARDYSFYLKELESLNIIDRSSDFKIGEKSKKIRLNWPEIDENQKKIKAPLTFYDAIRLTFTEAELQSYLKKLKMTSSRKNQLIAKIYEEEVPQGKLINKHSSRPPPRI
ncbi:hypothetical protein [Spirochaeta isovalerica]|uniref:Uncharacterized protein n=1 Tax=Spirochaeta isovalerica TaxID=150 RepID=A0A841RG91_9SPIO|nr:hypothetical protein [Spirochaeta isovalerica]MBB6481548.1 hypothetical protein [Spirochaeta isovalerica]